jgi:hypothetical protein
MSLQPVFLFWHHIRCIPAALYAQVIHRRWTFAQAGGYDTLQACRLCMRVWPLLFCLNQLLKMFIGFFKTPKTVQNDRTLSPVKV